MQNKGLRSYHGIIASFFAILFLMYGGIIVVPLFGEIGSLLAGLFIALIGVLFTFFTKTKASEVFPFKLPPVRQFFGSCFMYFSLMMVNASVSMITSKLFDPEIRNAEIDSMILKMSPFGAIMIVAVLPALCEEFFCRGFLVRCFNSIKNKKILVLLVGIIFGVMHLDPYSFFPTALMGAFLCFIAIKTESLLIPIFLHFANNALSVVMTFLSSAAEQSVSDGVSLSQLPIQSSVSMSFMYLSIAVLPFYIGYSLFNGKKVFRAKAFIAAAITISIFVSSMTSVLITSYDKYLEKEGKSEIVKDSECQYEIFVDEGAYYLNMTFNSDKKVDLKVYCGEKLVYESLGKSWGIISTAFESSLDRLRIVVSMPENGAEKTTLEYKYNLLKRIY